MKLFLIDGHALIFKMYYAFLGRPMINASGVDTSIIYGFSKYLLELIQREQPTHIAVAFDPPGGTFRNRLYPEYKANRSATPELVISSLEPLTQIVKALDIPVLMVSDFEADDVVGTVATRFASEELDVYMLTPDKDYGQLVRPHIFQYKPGKAGSDMELFGPEQVCQKYGISDTSQMIDMLALCGDSSDNVPGVPGVGPVGASKLLLKYSSLEGIYEHLDDLTAKQRASFETAKPYISLSKDLVTIKVDVPVEVTLEQMAISKSLPIRILELINHFQMPSLLRLVKSIWQIDENVDSAVSIESKHSISNSVESSLDKTEDQTPIELNYKELSPSDFIVKATNTKSISILKDSLNLIVAFSSINNSEEALSGPQSCYVSSGEAKEFKAILSDESKTKRTHGAKELMHFLFSEGLELKGKIEDAELMHYVLNPERNHSLNYIVKELLNIELDQNEEKEQLSLFSESEQSSEHLLKSCCALYYLVPNLYKTLHASLVDNHPFKSEKSSPVEGQLFGYEDDTNIVEDKTEISRAWVYDNIEEPLCRVLYEMERDGVLIDVSSLRDFTLSLKQGMAKCESFVRDVAKDAELNLSSPKQIGRLLYEVLELDPKMKKTSKGSWPTDEETLMTLADKSPIIEQILEYRGMRKLLSTYIEPIPQYISPRDGRVHTTFNQALTATGRLSSSNPNLQNIPIRTEQGREIRKAFTASPGCVIMSADYSQIELRVMAHCCADKHMIEAFKNGEDVHKAMAANIFHKSIDEVTAEDRRKAKTANFGIMYGISAFGLSQRLGISRTEASTLISDYFASFPSIKQFLDRILEDARKTGYVQTLFGRRRYVPDVNSRNGNVRALAERNAINAPIQGTAADIIKLAMIGVQRELARKNMKAKMVLQVHDELMLEVPLGEVEQVKRLLIEQMEGVVELAVPLTVECNYGKDWLEAH